MHQIGFPVRIALAVLATWRVTHLLSNEDGPADLFYHLRAKLGYSFAGRIMDCFYCLSVWIAAALATMVIRDFTDWVLTWLALSGGACLLERATHEPAVIQRFPAEGENDYGMLRSKEGQSEERSEIGRRG
jgi:hypothetical protein